MLQDRVIVVSGVGPGLGLEVARLCLRDGARVAIGARSAERLQAAAVELDPSCKRVVALPADITKAADCVHLAAVTVERFGRIDGVVQVAAMPTTIGEPLAIPPEIWRDSYETHILGTLNLMQAMVPHLQERGGSIVFIGTLSSDEPKPGMAAYGVTKGAMRFLMYYVANQVGAQNIRVNTVETSWMRGPLVEGYMQQVADSRGITLDQVLDEIAASWPLKKVPYDEDVAEAVIFLLSDRARMITGQTLRVDSGARMG
jgi:NAD(P)-dependent dehydrogenase (short-subunit alcohol dehydrogenase family)